MKTVWKYDVEVKDMLTIQMPEGAKLLCVKVQRGEPRLWVEVDPEADLVPRHFRVLGTGHFEDDWLMKELEYVDTFILHGGSFVGHLYARVQ